MQHNSLEAFKGRFVFDPSKAWHVGVERECFIVDPTTGGLKPEASLVLGVLWKKYPHLEERFGYELSACQLESRTPALRREHLREQLLSNRGVLDSVAQEVGFMTRYDGVAPESMPLDIYPDPAGRYASVAQRLPPDRLLAACRIIGTHIHVGMPDHATALNVYNGVIKFLHGLHIGADRTAGKRRRLFRMVIPDPTPVSFESWAHFHRHAIANGYELNPRDNWMEVRLTRYGTIEFRLFDGTDSEDEVVAWASACLALCRGNAN